MADRHSQLTAIPAPAQGTDLLWAERGDVPYKLTIQQIADYVGSGTDHGALIGLGDNDHPQYPLKASAETVSGAWTFSAQTRFNAVGTGAELTGTAGLGPIYADSHAADSWVGLVSQATTTGKQGGVVIQGSGSYGTKVHILTTDNYAAGAKLTATFDHTGHLTLPRSGLTATGIITASAGLIHTGKFATNGSYIDAYNWLSFQAGTYGLYWPTTQWEVNTPNTYTLKVKGGHASSIYLSLAASDGVVRSSVYSDTSGNFGFTNSAGSWAFRVLEGGSVYLYNTMYLGASGDQGLLSWSGGGTILRAAASKALYLEANNGAASINLSSAGGLNLLAASSSRPSLNVPHGSAPSSAVDGDLWSTTRGLFGQVNGYTTGFVPKRLFTTGSAVAAGPTRFYVEDGGYSENGSPNTGAIKVTFPHSWTDSMLWLRIRGYDYDASGHAGYGAWEILVGGYTYSVGSSWYNTSAHITGGRPRFTTVKFGHDGSKCCLVLGGTSDAHQYPKVEVVECSVGYAGATTYDYSSGWAVSRITVETGITYSGTTATMFPASTAPEANTVARRDGSNWLHAASFIANSGDWFRASGTGGLYNSTYATHLYYDSANYLNVGLGSTSTGGIRIRDTHAGTVRGYFYAEGANGVGILNDSGNWAVRAFQGGASAGGYLYGPWSAIATDFFVRSGGNWAAVNMRTVGDVYQGSFYADVNNHIGILNNGGSWAWRIDANRHAFGYGTTHVSTLALDDVYSAAALEVREYNYGGAQTANWTYAPRIAFHWSGRVASQIGMDWNGTLCVLDNPGTGYEDFKALTLGIGDGPYFSAGYSGSVRVTTASGWLDIGPQNGGWAHFETNTGKFYFGSEVRVNGLIGVYNGVPRMSLNAIDMQRVDSASTGIRHYSSTYRPWQTYMGPGNTASQGAGGDITTPVGTYVTSWALRSLVEDASGYGWTWEAGDATPSIKMELRSSDGLLYVAGAIYSGSYEMGFRDLPQNVQNATYTFAMSDRGKSVGKTNNTAYTYTVPPNGTVSFPVGTVITVFNYGSSGNISIAQGTGVTINKGTATGTRTLGPYGLCSLLKVSTDQWLISGSELT